MLTTSPPAPTLARAQPFFSPARRAGAWSFVSGQMPFDAQLRIVGNDVAEQTRVCLARIDEILQSEGMGLADIVKTMVWLRHVDDFAAFNSSYEAVFRARCERAPARSTVRADLMVPEALVEIEAVAYRPAAA